MLAHGTAAGAGSARRLLRVLGRVVIGVSLGVSVLTVAGLALVNLRGDQVMVVASGSMTPTFRAGDAVIVRPVEPGDLQPGTVITFHAPGEPEHLTTHRIVSRQHRVGELFLQTKGDSNATPDPNFVPAGAVVGILADSVPHLGHWLAFVEGPHGRLLVLGLPLLLLGIAQGAATVRDLRSRGAGTPAGARPQVLVTIVVVVLLSVTSGAVIARNTAATFADTQSVGANTFSTGSICSGTLYKDAVLADSPVIYHRFSETTGTTAANSGSGSAGTYVGGYTLGGSGATRCEATTRSVRLNGSNAEVTSQAAAAVAGPGTFSVEAWFKTTTGGGKLIGFGNSRNASSSSYDRHVYLSNEGNLVFGVYPNAVREVVSPSTYLDGQWHHVVATLNPTAGMALYVDGSLVASRTDTTTAQSYSGFWRIGYDNLTGWGRTPTNHRFTGDLDEVAVYGTSLTPARVLAHYNAR